MAGRYLVHFARLDNFFPVSKGIDDAPLQQVAVVRALAPVIGQALEHSRDLQVALRGPDLNVDVAPLDQPAGITAFFKSYRDVFDKTVHLFDLLCTFVDGEFSYCRVLFCTDSIYLPDSVNTSEEVP